MAQSVQTPLEAPPAAPPKQKKPRKKSKLRRNLIIIGIIVAIIVALIVMAMQSAGDLFTEETAKVQDILTYYSFTGNIESADSLNVVSKSNLMVKEFHVREGDVVQKGDLLFELDNASMNASLAQAEASVEIARINLERSAGTSKEQQLSQARLNLASAESAYANATGATRDQQLTQAQSSVELAKMSDESAQQNLARMRELYDAGAISLVELEQAQTSADNARIQLENANAALSGLQQSSNQNVSLASAQLKSAREAYNILTSSLDEGVRTAEEQLKQAEATLAGLQRQAEDLRVTAEIAGEVTEIHVSENESIVMGSRILDIVDYDNLEVTIKVDEYDLAAVTEGKTVEITINALNMVIEGHISDIQREAAVTSGISYFPTSVSFQSDSAVRIGMSAEVRMVNQDVKGATTISMKALQFDNENKPYVFYRDENGRSAIKYVTVGVNDGTTVQILEGVSEGETVLLPVSYLQMGMMAAMGEQ